MPGPGLFGVLGMGTELMKMFNKSDAYKDRHGCRTCRYGKKSLSYGECLHCERQRGTNWKTKKVHCECCGQVKP